MNSDHYLPCCVECGSIGWDAETDRCLRPECDGAFPEFLYASWPAS